MDSELECLRKSFERLIASAAAFALWLPGLAWTTLGLEPLGSAVLRRLLINEVNAERHRRGSDPITESAYAGIVRQGIDPLVAAADFALNLYR